MKINVILTKVKNNKKKHERNQINEQMGRKYT